MDLWEYHFKKAHENIQLSRKLHTEKQFGLSAFHAQQGLEIAIKAFCYEKKIHEIFSSKNALKTHLPSHVLIAKYFNYLIDMDN
ncbi:MAG: HEPN domain-containing protein [Nitrosopumilus sp.]|nr:HEPN domain-containing protein [Nitrosopumilus sp.]